MSDALKDITDPCFPDLATALDPERIAAVLQDAMVGLGSNHEILAAKISDVNYDPGQRCNLLLKLKVRKAGGGRTRRQMMTARLLKTGEDEPDGPSREEARRFGEAHASYLPGPYFCVDHPRMVLYTFPHDPAMPWMVEGLDEFQSLFST